MSTRWRSSLITIALLAVLVVGYKVYGDLAGRLDKDLKKLEADARSRLPVKVDEFTTLVDVTYEPHKHVYLHVIEVKDGERVDRQKLKQSAQNQVCGNTDAVHLIREKGLSYEYRYTDRARTPLAAFTIANCP